MNELTLSVIVPFYNEKENIGKLHNELVPVLSNLDSKCEIIYVDDGSTDGSKDVLLNVIDNGASEIKVKIISFNRNFGQTAAVKAGIDNADGDLISFLDADLQNDPRSIPKFLEKMTEGYDAVFGWRSERKDASVRSFLSRLANLI